MTAREVLDGIKARESATDPLCADCGKCRVVEDEGWCYGCRDRSCERGPDCADSGPTDVARLVAAVEAVLMACDRVIDNTDGHKPPGPPHPTQQQATAVRIRATIEAALKEDPQ